MTPLVSALLVLFQVARRPSSPAIREPGPGSWIAGREGRNNVTVFTIYSRENQTIPLELRLWRSVLLTTPLVRPTSVIYTAKQGDKSTLPEFPSPRGRGRLFALFSCVTPVNRIGGIVLSLSPFTLCQMGETMNKVPGECGAPEEIRNVINVGTLQVRKQSKRFALKH